MNWKHGYYAESGYTYGCYPETMPLRLHFAALLQGHEAPRKQFRYLDAGCGQGMNLILAAACHPDSEFVGIDFLPEHIAHASRLAAQCDLKNIIFIEGDFIELAKAPLQHPALAAQFDYVVCHGISTWIAPAVKHGLFSLVGQVLKPGGLFYNSYNTYPSWLGIVPFQHLVLLEQDGKSGEKALSAVRGHMDKLRGIAPTLFEKLPDLQDKIAKMAGQDPAYLVQEYNNQYWQPVFVSQMMADLAAFKLTYLGTATLTEAFDAILDVSVREWLAEQATVSLKEQLRDYALHQGFRRDLYVKGQMKPWPRAHEASLMELVFQVNSLKKRPEAGESYKIKNGAVEAIGDAALYGQIIDLIMSRPEGMSLRDITTAKSQTLQPQQAIVVLSLLICGGWLHLCNENPGNSESTNRILAQAIADGAPYKYICLPNAGMAHAIGDIDGMMLNLHFKGVPASEWPQEIEQGLQRLNRVLSQEGKPVTDPQSKQATLVQAMAQFENLELPYFRRVGAA